MASDDFDLVFFSSVLDPDDFIRVYTVCKDK